MTNMIVNCIELSVNMPVVDKILRSFLYLQKDKNKQQKTHKELSLELKKKQFQNSVPFLLLR